MESKTRRKGRKKATPKRGGPKTVTGLSRLKKASLFMNGRSQAVRLPKEFRFEGTHVFVKRDGNRVILMPEDDRIERLIAAMGSAPNFPDIPRDPPEPMRPALKELFDISD
jgi:antitoxin VapB